LELSIEIFAYLWDEVEWTDIVPESITFRILKRILKDYNIQSSSVGESHPHALPEPDMNLSTHPAPIDQPQ
jgi:hypothetical protein